MRLTLALLCSWFAIYCGSSHNNNGHGSVVLSLPPSLIANAAALRQQQQQHHELQQQQQHEQSLRWKKDARVLFDRSSGAGGGSNVLSGSDGLRDMAVAHKALKQQQQPPLLQSNVDESEQSQSQSEPQPADFNRKPASEEYDLEPAATETETQAEAKQSAPQEIAPRLRAVDTLKYSTPYKYSARRCLTAGGIGNCPQEYYNAMLAARNRAAMRQHLHQQNAMKEQEQRHKASRQEATDNVDTDEEDISEVVEDINNDVMMLLTGEQDLITFLYWAMELLYPLQHPDGNVSANDREYFHLKMNMPLFKKLNLSGHLEPPLIVDEPRYILVRREQMQEDYKPGDNQDDQDDPFIPPRGRKHNSLDLDELMQRYEPFVPNRGKRDKVKDMFKYEDLFFPNRGKKHRSILKLDDPFFPNRGKKLQLRDIYNLNDPFFPNRGKRQIQLPEILAWRRIWEKLKRKLLERQQQEQLGQQLVVNEINDNGDGGGGGGGEPSEWPQRMSTHKINGYDQSVKPSMSAAATLTAAAAAKRPEDANDAVEADEGARLRRLAAARLAANRLHSTRSMSTNSQLRQRQQLLQLQQQRQHEAEVRQQQQQRQQGLHKRPMAMNPGMRHQVKTSYGGDDSLAPSLLWRQLQQQQKLPRETQLTRAGIANPDEDSDSDDDNDRNDLANGISIDTDYGNFDI